MLSILKGLFRGKGETIWGKSYKGLLIKSDFRVHDAAFGLIRKEAGSRKTLKVLDIATGTGALAQRISDGFPGWEVEVNDFESQAQVKRLKKYGVDLNEIFHRSFAEGGYDIVVAVEIIEHLENPWHFLREIKKLLRKDGILVLSTPNVDSTLDRLVYLRDGHTLYFGAPGYVNSGGHITPVPDWLLRKAAEAGGYSKVDLNGDVDTSPHIGRLAWLKLLLLMPFLRFYMKNTNDRSINVYVCK